MNKQKPDWLKNPKITLGSSNSAIQLDFNTPVPGLQSGDRVRSVKSLTIGDVFIPLGATGTISETDGVVHVIAFDSMEGLHKILPEEVIRISYNTSAHDPKFFHTPDKKRVVAPSTWGNRLALIHMADSLEKLANSVGFYGIQTKVLRTELDPHDQYVRAAEFEISFKTDDNLRQTVRASVGMDASNKRVIMPTTFTYLGRDIPFEKKAVEDLHATKHIETNYLAPPTGELSYVKRDPARYHVTANVNKREHVQVITDQSDSPYRKVLADLVSQSGEEYKFEDNKFRCLETGQPVMEEKHKEDFELWLNPDETTRDYSTQDGQDEVKDKEERIDEALLGSTTSGIIDPFEKIAVEKDYYSNDELWEKAKAQVDRSKYHTSNEYAQALQKMYKRLGGKAVDADTYYEDHPDEVIDNTPYSEYTDKDYSSIFRKEWSKATHEFDFYPDANVSTPLEQEFIDMCHSVEDNPKFNELFPKQGPIQARLMILEALKEENNLRKTV